MAHKKAGGSSRNGRDSSGQRRGVKRFAGQVVQPDPGECAESYFERADPIDAAEKGVGGQPTLHLALRFLDVDGIAADAEGLRQDD